MTRKNLFLLLLFLFLPVGMTWAQSGTYTAGGVEWKYDIEGTEATITGEVRGRSLFVGVINIPDNVMHNGVYYPVTKIGERAFERYRIYSPLTIPASVKVIGNRAFSGCNNFSGNLFLPNVVTIGESAFQECRSLTGSLSLPNAVTIGNSAFNGCTGFNGSLSIPNVTTLGNRAFYQCTGFTGSLSLPNVTKIEEYTFSGCRGFNGSLSLPNVTTIDNHAFYECRGFTGTLTMSNVITIGEYAFYGCRGFTGSLSLPNVTLIDQYAFYNCLGFNGTLTIPNVTTINQAAFSTCSGFTGTLSLPNATVIGDYAFLACDHFTGSLDLPKITVANQSAFGGCRGFNGTLSLPNVIGIEPSAFAACGFTTVSMPKVWQIGSNAFQSCTGLNGVLELPKTLQNIYGLTFAFCSNLKAVKFESGTTLMNVAGYQHFLQCTSLQYIDMTGVTFPAGFIVSRNSSGMSLFQGTEPYTMVYLPTSAPAVESGQENFVIGGTCDKFVVYDYHHNYKSANVGGDYPIQYNFTANTVEYKNRDFSGATCKSLCLPYPATLPAGMTAYTLTRRKANNNFLFTSVAKAVDGTTPLAANTAYLLQVNDGATHTFPTESNVAVPVTPTTIETQATDGSGFYFGGTTTNIDNATAAGNNYYNLSNDKWYPIRTTDTNGYVHSFRAYIRTTGGTPAKGFAMVLDSDDEKTTTDIDNAAELTEDELKSGKHTFYTLDGRRAGTDYNTLKSGEMYIVKGQKFYKF